MLVRPGIYVAFDRHGEHCGYARHPDFHNCPERFQEQTRKVEALEEEAQRRGGKVMLLSLEEFDKLILLHIRPEDRRTADKSNVAA
ncbi:hypothetical protein [Brucella pituitosa]|uniref:hypothetical protein n=1 Tax=Brucella pituitosa TaxID=571256 RepID=UPI0009A137E2|nr:hypothetical protein [Brucella pituitosa]